MNLKNQYGISCNNKLEYNSKYKPSLYVSRLERLTKVAILKEIISISRGAEIHRINYEEARNLLKKENTIN
jgi:hypothetical protein